MSNTTEKLRKPRKGSERQLSRQTFLFFSYQKGFSSASSHLSVSGPTSKQMEAGGGSFSRARRLGKLPSPSCPPAVCRARYMPMSLPSDFMPRQLTQRLPRIWPAYDVSNHVLLCLPFAVWCRQQRKAAPSIKLATFNHLRMPNFYLRKHASSSPPESGSYHR